MLITFSDTRFLALNIDHEGAVFSPIRGRGGAHVLTLPEAERPGGDVLAFADKNGKMLAVCGSKLTAANLTEGASRGMCTHCDVWLRTEEYALEMARAITAWDVASKGTGESVIDLVTEADLSSVVPAPESVSAPVELAPCSGAGSAPVDGTRAKDTSGNVTGQCAVCADTVAVARVANGKVRPHRTTASQKSGNAIREEKERAVKDAAPAVPEGSGSTAPVAVESTGTKAPEESVSQKTDNGQKGKNTARTLRVAAVRPGQDTLASLTDGKCAYEVRENDGTLTLKPVHGRSKIAPVAGTVTVNTGPGNGESGTCPLCGTFVKLTSQGFVPTHRPGNITPDGPVLTQRAIPAVEKGTAVADAAKVRESEATALITENGDVLSRKEALRRLRAGEDVREVPVIPTAPVRVTHKGRAAIGNREHGRSDGVALSPGNLKPAAAPEGEIPAMPSKGWAAKAGTMRLPIVPLSRQRPDAGVIKDVMHGGKGGYLTEDDYNLLSRTQQRAYWKNVKTARNRAKEARALVTARHEALGQKMPAADQKVARKAASVGSSADGTIAGPVTRVKNKGKRK